MLSGAKKILHDFAPVIFLATHGADIHQQCCDFLESLGYRLQCIGGKSIYDTDEILAFKK